MLNLELINYGNEIEETISLISYVSKPIESLKYSKYINDRSVALEYIESKEINSKENIIIEDLSWKAPKNNENFLKAEEEFTINGGSFYSEFKDIVLTNKVSLDVQGQEIPLFYKHKRKVKEASVHCVKNGDNFTIDSGFLVEDNHVYTNYKNYYEEKNGKYILYFVSGVDIEGNSFNELLNLEPVIKEGSWENIDLDSGEIESDVYLKEEEGLGYRYTLKLNAGCKSKSTSDLIYAKGLNTNLIKILKPETFSLDSRWTLQVQNGSFVQNGKLYKLPEYNQQPFNPIYGVLFFRNRVCFNTNSNVIKLPVKSIIVSPSNYMHIEVFIHDSEENLIKAVTTNKELLGTIVKDEITYEQGIVSWDEKDAFVELDFTVVTSQIVTANFYYKAESFLIKEVDFNPFYNEEFIYNKYFFYLKPFKSKLKRALEYLILDEDERILSCSEDELKVEVNRTFNSNTIVGSHLKEFLEQYCYGYENELQYLELGEIYLLDNSYVDEVVSLDIREKTFVKSESYEDLIKRQWKVLQSKFGYGDLGQIIQKNNLIYTEVPHSLLDEYSEEEVEQMLRKHLPATLDLIIEYVFPKSKIEFDLNTPGEVTLNMSWETPGIYNIYRSNIKIKRDESVKIHSINSQNEESLSYIDTDVESGNNYYYWVRIDGHPYSDTFGVKIR